MSDTQNETHSRNCLSHLPFGACTCSVENNPAELAVKQDDARKGGYEPVMEPEKDEFGPVNLNGVEPDKLSKPLTTELLEHGLPGTKASDMQVGGTHYKDYPIEPGYYAQINGLNAMEFCVVKYVTRHKSKHGLEDINKAIHCLELIKEWEYGYNATTDDKAE